MARKLASIQKVWNIVPIEGADAIEAACVLGWKVVVRKGEIAIGEKCVYFEIDSFLPVEERYEFLRATSYRKSEIWGEGFRIKTLKMRGQISQGLLIPVRHFEGFDEYEIGYDVTQELGIKKWEVPEMETSGGTRIGDFVPYCSKTDEIRIQTMPEVLDELRGKPYYISTKIDGTSCTITCMDNVIQVCGRNLEYKDEAKCSMWALVHRLELDEKLRTYGKNIGIQGEFAGPGIQKNRLRLNKGDLYVFNIIDLDNRRRYDLDSMLAVCERLGLKTVPIEETGEAFAYDTIEELLERARGKYKSGLAKEGIVVRSTTHDYSQSLQGPLSFKVLNNDFLLKEK